MIAEPYPWVSWALTTEPRHERSASVAYHLPPPCWPRRATSRSIHLEPLTNLGHISKPEHQQISPRWLYAYASRALRRLLPIRQAQESIRRDAGCDPGTEPTTRDRKSACGAQGEATGAWDRADRRGQGPAPAAHTGVLDSKRTGTSGRFTEAQAC